MNKLNAQQIWQGFHWSFFINIQGLIISLNRLEQQITSGNISEAKIEFATATNLLLASGAAMQLAGSFSQQEYENQVRPSMTPPQVYSQDFSGLMSWEHAALIQVWKKLRPLFKNLPTALEPQHDEFIAAYLNLAASHKAVCKKFGGEEQGSLRLNKNNALEILDKFRDSRLRLIAD